MVWGHHDLQFDKNCDLNHPLENITSPLFENVADEADSMTSSGKCDLFEML